MRERDNAPAAVRGRLRALMASAGMTPEAVAEVTWAPGSHVAAWLDGRLCPGRRPMRRLAIRTGVSLAWIFYGDEGDLPPGTAKRLRAAMDEQAAAE